MAGQEVSCTQSARGPLVAPPATETIDSAESAKEVDHMIARVGKAAPDFEAMAYHEGRFKLIKLSEFRGQWTLVCFYPGDFTFV